MSQSSKLTRSSKGAWLLFIAVAGYVLVPLLWVVINSTKSNADLYTTFGFSFGNSFELFSNIAGVFAHDSGIYGRWFANTVVYAVIGAAGATITSYLAAYAFSVWRFRYRETLFWIIIGAMMIPNTALAVPIFQMYSTLGLTNTAAAVILPTMVNPFTLYLLRVYLDGSIPPDLIDAARVDGASEARILTQIVPPVARTGLVTVALLAFVSCWNNYLIPLLVLTDSSLFPITLGLADWNRTSLNPVSGEEALYTLVITGSLLAALPIMALFLVMFRQLRSGLALGSSR